jgi:hypothetical protein
LREELLFKTELLWSLENWDNCRVLGYLAIVSGMETAMRDGCEETRV